MFFKGILSVLVGLSGHDMSDRHAWELTLDWAGMHRACILYAVAQIHEKVGEEVEHNCKDAAEQGIAHNKPCIKQLCLRLFKTQKTEIPRAR